VGDDIKSQVGATITHRILTHLFRMRGVRLDHTYQLNFGGNMDFFNMLERERLESKKVSKTNAVTSQLGYETGRDEDEAEPAGASFSSQLSYQLGEGNVHVGPSDYVPWLTDRKFCYIQMEGTTFGEVPLKLELKLEVWDSPNSAGVVIDALRCCKIAKDRGMSGTIEAPSAYFMKSPPIQYTDEEARMLVEDFIRG
jgi:myo-inositol-1-phosphate synthase